ncbi:hypothetical protein ACCS93_37635 [Rhizobium ruizarguesonis]
MVAAKPIATRSGEIHSGVNVALCGSPRDGVVMLPVMLDAIGKLRFEIFEWVDRGFGLVAQDT